MKTYKILGLLALFLVSSCKTDEKKSITNPEDYAAFLSTSSLEKTKQAEQTFQFWQNKLQNTPNQYIYHSKIAGAQTNVFSASANIEALKLAEENLAQLNTKTNYINASNLRALAHNYISQHRFKEALILVEEAKAIGENLKGSQKMLFDIHLELGNTKEAKTYLEKIKNFSDFGYLIRLSKWSDHNSDLDSAIKYMEQATKIAESSNLKDSKIWAYTNLADFYGHSGQIEKAYNYYLKALTLEPSNAYAKKGIAWIEFSYEKNTAQAQTIINHIMESYQAPDLYLFQAEIAASNNNTALETEAMNNYFKAVKNANYGDMYNVYSAKALAETNPKKAHQLAQIEIANRPTAMSYGLLAYTTLKTGNKEKALAIIDDNVLPFTTEPDALFYAAKIYAANGKTEGLKDLKKELVDSAFEIGPVTLLEVQNI